MATTKTYSKILEEAILMAIDLTSLSGKKINKEASVLLPLNFEKPEEIETDCVSDYY